MEDDDLDAWISGAKLPERAATVYGRGDLVGEFESLDARLTKARSDAEREVEAGDARLMSGADTAGIVAEMERVKAEMEASARTFRFRAATLEAQRSLKERLGGDKADEDAYAYELLGLQSIDGVTAGQWATIRARVGEGQFQGLLDAASKASWERQPSVPFSFNASAIRGTQAS